MTPNEYDSRPYAIESISRQTNDTLLFRIKTRLNPSPGQFVQLSMPGIGEAPISSASCAHNHLDLLIRDVGNVTNAVFKLKKGQQICLRGPYGNGYPLEKLKGNNIIIIGGGTGVAPLRGVIEYLEKHRADYKEVILFLGYRRPSEILFRDDLKRWQEQFDVRLTVDNAEKNWQGNVGVITKIVDAAALNNHNKVVLICGPPIMIRFVMISLRGKGFHDDQIFVSHERHMKCGIGKCGHCMIHGQYVCKDGPVFRFDSVKDIME